MSEAAFPLLGTAFVVVVLLPLCALLAKAGLVLLERDEVGGPLHGLTLRYLLLTFASALPIAWLFSAALHQAESGQSALACLLDHDAAALCFEPGFFAAALALAVLVSSARTLAARRAVPAGRSEGARQLTQRLERLIAREPWLAPLRGRLVATDAAGFALGTHGVLRPRVGVGTAFANSLSDAMLAGALGHELEHVRALDPLRYLLLQLALDVNPLGRAWLTPHAARWQAAREAHCDREAVLAGASPLALAEAIVRAARPSPREGVALGAPDTAVLKFRVGLLLAFAETPPSRCCPRRPSSAPAAVALLLLALLLPHQTGSAALDALHTGAEHALHYLSR